MSDQPNAFKTHMRRVDDEITQRTRRRMSVREAQRLIEDRELLEARATQKRLRDEMYARRARRAAA